MAIKRFSGSFRTRDDVFDNITPNNMVQPKVSHPAGEWKPAAWLPVQWKGEASKDYFVISSGKVVSLTSDGRVVPSGLRKRLAANGGALTLTDNSNTKTLTEIGSETFITYTANDVKAKTEDLTTGSAVTAAKTVTVGDACEAIINRGLVFASTATGDGGIDISNSSSNSFGGQPLSNQASVAALELEAGTDIVDIIFQMNLIIEKFISEPIGVCAYDVYSWAGDTPASLKFVNYQKQHLIQFITEAQMKMPLAALKTQDSTSLANTAYVAGTHGTEMVAGTAPVVLSASDLRGFSRYSNGNDEVLNVASGASVKGLYLGAINLVPEIAALTVADVSTKLVASGTQAAAAVVNAKSRIQDIGKIGDYFFDAQAGIVVVHSDFVEGSITSDAIAFYTYTGAESQDHQHIYFVGPCQPGDRLTFDQFSNFTVAGSTDESLGRVLEVQSFPKSLMERTTTAWQGSSFDASMRMPGSATQGLPDNLTLSGQNDEVVGNRMVIANIRIL